MSLHGIISLAALAIVAIVLFDFVYSYVKSNSSGFQRWIDAGRGSATMVAAQLGGVVALFVASSQKITDWICGAINAPGADEAIKQGIQQLVTPTNAGLALAAFALAVAVARARTLGK